MRLSTSWRLAKQAAVVWSDDYAPSMGAALAYYTTFSAAPLLLIVVSVAGLVFGEEAARGEIFAQLRGMIGTEGAVAVQGLLESVSKPKEGILATLIGVTVLLIGATTVFAELQDSLDRIWRAPVRTRSSGLWTLLRARILSFGMILGIGFLLMVSLVVSAALSALGRWWAPFFGAWEVALQGANLLVSFALITVIFALIYKVMPRARVEWRDVWIGAAVTALLFSIGKSLIGLYIGRSGVTSGFGAAGSLAVLLIWVYYSAQIFLLGAEFTWVYAHSHGSRRGEATTPEELSRTNAPAPARRAAA
jgi:membrane protein